MRTSLFARFSATTYCDYFGNSDILSLFNKLIFCFLSITLFRLNQTALPRSHTLLLITLILYMVVSVGLYAITTSFMANVAAQAPLDSTEQEIYATQNVTMLHNIGLNLFSLLLDIALIYGLLRVFNLQERAYQTIFAIFGVRVILLGILCLVMQLFKSEYQIIALLPIFAIVIWGYAVQGYLLAFALDTRLAWGVFIAVAMSFIGYLATSALFGPV